MAPLQRCFAAVATLEPAFQLAVGTWDAPWLAHAYLAVHLFGFNLVQLHLYRRRGFLAMLAFRPTYYAAWHIAWGYLRLELLFTAS